MSILRRLRQRPGYSEIPQDKLLIEEAARVRARRDTLGIAHHVPGVGLSLSGGGIRSATFSLGLLRELAAQKLIHRVDYLSTVSGGTYVGAYFAGLFASRQPRGETDPVAPVLDAASFIPPTAPHAPLDPFEDARGLPRASLDWLRQSGRYLAPQGAGDFWSAIGLIARNWIGLHLVIGTTIMLAMVLAVGLRMVVYLHPWASLPGADIALPILLLRAPLLAFIAIPVAIHIAYAWAYWLTRRDVVAQSHSNFAQVGSVIILVCALLIVWSPGLAGLFSPALTTVRATAAIVATFAAAGVLLLSLSRAAAGHGISAEEEWDHRRAWLTRPMALCASLFAAVLVAAATDTLAFWIYWSGFAALIASLSPVATMVLVPAGRWLVGQMMQTSSSVPTAPASGLGALFNRDNAIKLASALGAILLLVAVVMFWAVLAYKLIWPASATVVVSKSQCGLWSGGQTAAGQRDCLVLDGAAWTQSWHAWLSWTAVLAFLSVCMARTRIFLNLSGLTAFYAGRLRRAYLGAGNPKRLRVAEAGKAMVALDRWEENDDVSLEHYYGGSAAPLHLIATTLNETRGTGSNIVQHDRRGRNLVLSPGGIYCNADRKDHIFHIPLAGEEHEPLPLSTWVAISGAAFSTGLGNRNGFPMSLLAGLANVRLGYWWRTTFKLAPSLTQRDLLREFRGDFSGPSESYWYLSDGGHFENTGIYELIRRAVPFIIASDNGMDQRYEYEDIANLVRKARIDFDCDINFLNETQLDTALGQKTALRVQFGTLSQIGGKAEMPSKTAVAALARLTYGNGTRGTLVLVKPRFTGDGPADLVRYKEANAPFPQQTTLDQFFDEAQWESYYHLGRLIAQAIFAPPDKNNPPPWSPSSLVPMA